MSTHDFAYIKFILVLLFQSAHQFPPKSPLRIERMKKWI